MARRLREARVRSGWTQEQLAERAAIAAATLSRYERAGSSIPLEVLRRAALALGTTLGKLVDVESELPRRWTPPPEFRRLPRRAEEEAMLEVWRALKPRERKLFFMMCKSIATAGIGAKRGRR